MNKKCRSLKEQKHQKPQFFWQTGASKVREMFAKGVSSVKKFRMMRAKEQDFQEILFYPQLQGFRKVLKELELGCKKYL